MDKEGILMFKALSICSNLSEFEFFLDTLSKPYGVEANFGVIDAYGGSAYYEVNNYKWIKTEVTDYKIVTNFCEHGRKEDYKGLERFNTASEIIKNTDISTFSHKELFNSLSRSYYNSEIGINYKLSYDKLKELGFTGIIPDQDFIPRKSTSASVVIEGVKAGENPLHTVMWTILGYPAASVAIPLLVGKEDILPDYIKKTIESKNSSLCDKALEIKQNYIFQKTVSSGSKYLNINYILNGKEGEDSLLECASKTEDFINKEFYKIFRKWEKGTISDKKFYKKYKDIVNDFYDLYLKNFHAYLL